MAAPHPPPVVCASEPAVGRLAAELVVNRLLARPALRMLLPTGWTTRSFAAALRHDVEGHSGLAATPGPVADPAAPASDRGALDLAVVGLGGHGQITRHPPTADALEADLQTLLACREILLLVTGVEKAAILRRVLTEPPGPDLPASLLRAHRRLTVLCDPAAAGELRLGPHHRADHVVVVLGHREPGISPEHRISVESLQRVQRAERLVRHRPTRAAVLTGYTSTGGLSEAEQMAAGWRDPEVPWLLEVAGRDTAENASRSMPLVQALGGVRQVTVVTSAWHVRAGWFFAPYRRAGLRLHVRHEWRGRGATRLLAGELRKLPDAHRSRDAAWRTD